jgi:hypothetical protein
MELVEDSLRYLFTPGWAAWPFVPPIHGLSFSPFLQHLKKSTDILNRLPGFLLGNTPAGSALEYRNGFFNQFRAVLHHFSTPNKKTPQKPARLSPCGVYFRLAAKLKNANHRAREFVLLKNWPHNWRGISTNCVESKKLFSGNPGNF